MSEELRARMAAIIREDLAEEAAQGFPLLKRFPNSETASVAGHVAALGSAEAEVETALGKRRYACVVIGAGLREPSQHLLLFEKVLNLVHRLAPEARVAFNTTPADTAEAVDRWVSP